MVWEPKMSHHQLTNTHLPHVSREITREPLKTFESSSKGMQTDGSNSVSSSLSIQGFELSDFATTFIDLSEPTLPDHENLNHTENKESRPSTCLTGPEGGITLCLGLVFGVDSIIGNCQHVAIYQKKISML